MSQQSNSLENSIYRDFCNGMKNQSREQATQIEMSSSKLAQIKDVDIDSSGKFKYILINVKDPENKEEKFIVRGYKACAYHSDIFDLIEPHIKKHNCKATCVGGGRIKHEPSVKSIFIYGYSQGFGKADHSITQKILKEKFTDYSDISWSNEGY